ncbi:calcium-dependent cell adhesion molecule-1 [Cavenderia fasciculata]|uniref:Calcium-dependent cell adhesion molecule-1 n=1 Tax=Cavenderia fasciculata TaxID=261658 RepID=F4PX19_CACFS|nr:calcium-dependent cell adhesion molecule-1 [Cavenderia fasciculata]EGG19822.1 calcium-dependent cell adhesion molecule-1 [Cavenderia fasciculata]|eukprot:XP_004358168.1 calcium-dependent cell adhesion molecule-1 [Cavenderia fasciculata]
MSVTFYTAKNYGGESVNYAQGTSVAFLPNDKYNDKFLSCKVTSGTWVNAYEHNDAFNPEAGAHEELRGDNPDLSSLNGLSMFQVLADSFGYAIDIKLVCGGSLSSAAAGSYKMTFIPYQVNPVTTMNGDAYIQCPIPKLTPPDSEIVCQLSCQETAWPGATVANGSVYFKYTPNTGVISFRKTEGFPTNMDVTQDGKTNFIFSLNSRP